MKFTTERDALLRTLSTAVRATGQRGDILGLSALHLSLDGDDLTVSGSNGDMMIESHMTVDGQIKGAIAVPGKLLTSIVRSLPDGAVTIMEHEKKAQVSCGRSRFNLHIYQDAELLRIREPDGAEINVESGPFIKAIGAVVKAASTDSARPLLTAVLAVQKDDHLRLVATDSYRMAISDVDGKTLFTDETGVLIPASALAEVERLVGDVETVYFQGGTDSASFAVNGTTITTRLLEGKYPNYEQLVPESSTGRFTFNRDEMLGAVKRLAVMQSDNTTPVKLTFSKDDVVNLDIAANEVGTGNDVVTGTYVGDDGFVIAFNPVYFQDGLEAIGADEAMLSFVDASKPAVLTARDDSSSLYLLMSVRVS